MQFNEFKELVKKNRSFRGYDNTVKLSKEECLDIVDCARLSASSINQQPLKFYIACEGKKVDEIFATTGWAKGLPNLKLPREGEEPTAYITICLDTNISDNVKLYTRDAGIVAQTMQLAACSMGYGGCMIGSFGAAKVSEILNLPEYLKPMLILALGKPSETVKMLDVNEGEAIGYYRDENNVHFVPKRKLEDITVFTEK